MKLIFVFLILFSFPLLAAQQAVVVTEGAIVYRKPDFDSPVIGYFQRGRKVAISSKQFGPFFRVKFKQGLLGYISDVDVSFDGKGKMPEAKDSKASPEKEKKAQRKKDEPPWRSMAIGPAIGYVQFAEVIGQTELNTKITPLGLQFSTPFTYFDGPFNLETTFLYNAGAPSYYQQVSTTAPTGNLLFLDSVLTFPLSTFSGVSGAVVLGAGPLLNQTTVEATIGGTQKDLRELKLGLSVVGGVAYRLDRILIKLEAKYFVEKASYLGFLGTIQYVIK